MFRSKPISWVLYFVLHSVTCLKTCHFTACFTSLWIPISVSILILHATSSRVCLYLLIFITLHTQFHTHIQRHTHTSTHVWPAHWQEEWQQPGTGAWLGGAEERLWLETKALHTHKKEKEKKNVRKSDISNPKKDVGHVELPAKLLDYFLRSNKSTINQISRLKKESCGFPRNCAGVRHCVMLIAPRRVRKMN